MVTRRDFLKTSSLTLAGIPFLGLSDSFSGYKTSYKNKRPAPGDRKFVCKAVDRQIDIIKKNINDEELASLFENCFPNTLDTTVKFQMIDGRPDTFVITGDINAMWLRDSSAQVWPYVFLADKDERLKKLIAGVINRQTKCILFDPYANAFNYGPTGSQWDKDLTAMKPELHERKWEIDSLCYPIRLAYGYWKTTGDTSCFDEDWIKAMKSILITFKQQQRKNGPGPYKFQRITATQSDTVAGDGYGNPVKPVGLICSIFRPSDDSTIFPFLVPSNYFAVTSLRQLSEMMTKAFKENEFALRCSALADEVETALRNYTVKKHLDFGNILAYEVDGFGNRLFMDDANVPSLLSLPYLNCMPADSEIYRNTRKFLFSGNNPYYFKGKAADGIGSPHTGLGKIWPIGIMMRAFTSTDDEEIKICLKMLKRSSEGTGFMHEAFDKDNPSKFSRKWFAWANTLFGELILKLFKEKPYLLNG